MFPRLRQQVLARLDLVVELSTLGEYGIDEHGGVMALETRAVPARRTPRLRDRCGVDVATASGRGVPTRP
jgi:hypothetical protein